MREAPVDHSKRDEERCCISSDGKGRILTTSFPIISHPSSVRPVPESLYFFERFDSDNTGTAVAQVGRVVSLVPSSQKLQNGTWANWLKQPTSPIDTDAAVEGSRVSLEHRVSPGISELRPLIQELEPSSLPSGGSSGRIPGGINPTRYRDLDRLLSSSDTSQILTRYEDLVSKLSRGPGQSDPTDFCNSTSEHAPEPRTEDNAATDTPNAEMATSAADHNHGEVGSQARADNTQDCTATADDVGILQSKHVLDHSSLQPSLRQEEEGVASDGSDPDMAWKTFLFGGEKSDEVSKAVLEEAFAEAKQVATGRSQPAKPLASPDQRPASDDGSNIATVGTLYPNHEHITSESTAASVKFSAQSDSASAQMESEQVLDISDDSALTCSVEANVGSSSVPAAETSGGITDTAKPRSTRDKESAMSEPWPGPPPSITTSLAFASPRSRVAPSEAGTAGGAPGEQFRFTQPKLFIGSRCSVPQPSRGPEPGVGISITRRRRGRPRRRANDGRADIRALPNYSSDPIEEFGDDERAQVREHGLFPALELA